MATPKLTIVQFQDVLALSSKHDRNISRIAEEMNLSRSAVRNQLVQAEAWEATQKKAGGFESPELLSPDTPISEILAAKKRRFSRLRDAEESARWMKFKVRTDGPYGLAFFGDPHLDDDGCNIDLVEHHLSLVRETEALWGVGMGDYTNNWSGRLQRIYAEQSTTRTEAWALAEWFFGQGIWWLLIKGNHDLWSASHGNGDPLDWMQRGTAHLREWQARFIAESPNGVQVKVHASHNFKGHSQWNTLHAAGKAAKFQEEADLYIDADKHNWAVRQEEDQQRPGRVYWTARCRGYKYVDSYSEQLGYSPQEHGATVAMVVDPDGKGPNRIHCFADLDEGVDFLKFKRRAVNA